jgi:hypothetical protein
MKPTSSPNPKQKQMAHHPSQKAKKALAVILGGNFTNPPSVDQFRIQYLNKVLAEANRQKKVFAHFDYQVDLFPFDELEALDFQHIQAEYARNQRQKILQEIQNVKIPEALKECNVAIINKNPLQAHLNAYFEEFPPKVTPKITILVQGKEI